MKSITFLVWVVKPATIDVLYLDDDITHLLQMTRDISSVSAPPCFTKAFLRLTLRAAANFPSLSGQEDSFSGWGDPARNDTTSLVRLRPTSADDGAGYSCVAKHRAVRPEDQRYFNSTVPLSVLCESDDGAEAVL